MRRVPQQRSARALGARYVQERGLGRPRTVAPCRDAATHVRAGAHAATSIIGDGRPKRAKQRRVVRVVVRRVGAEPAGPHIEHQDDEAEIPSRRARRGGGGGVASRALRRPLLGRGARRLAPETLLLAQMHGGLLAAAPPPAPRAPADDHVIYVPTGS